MIWWRKMLQWFMPSRPAKQEVAKCKDQERQDLQRRNVQAERRLKALETEAQILQRRAHVHNKSY